MTMPNGLKKSYKYDKLKRSAESVCEINGNKIMREKYAYIQNGDRATGLVSSVMYKGNGAAGEYVKYAYDETGNITEVRLNNALIRRYGYDSLSRLIREDNADLCKTVKYAYDGAGNILCRTEYGFTLGDPEGKGNAASYDYDAKHPDRLISYNGQSFAYDEIGNPTIYRNKALVWEKGRELKSYDGLIFGYDGYGKRISKGNTQYVYAGDRLVSEVTNGAVLGYIYDETGVRSIKYNNAWYSFIKNLQGDVTGILDNTGNTVVKYVYDAWGKHKVCNADGAENTDANFIGNINPIRYRSYYFDRETGLYFLGSRYYDPEIGRFIEPDDIDYLDPTTVNGLNLYSYCGNNPVMNIDPDGHTFFSFLIGLAISSLAMWAAGQVFGHQLIGGIGSIANGAGSIGTGFGLLSFGPVGWILGGILIVAGATSIAFGGVEIGNHFFGVNLFTDVWGMDSGWYNGLYIASNVISAVGTITGNAYMRTHPPYPGNNPNKTPAGFNSRANPNANYYNPRTGQSLRPDLGHPKPIGGHWDWKNSNGVWWRLFSFFRRRK